MDKHRLSTYAKRRIERGILLFGLALGLNAHQAVAADWSDASLGFRYGTRFEQPGSDDKIRKDIINFTYVGGSKYFVNFFTVDMLNYQTNEPAKGPNNATPSDRGSHELYAVYSSTLSLGALSESGLKFGPVKDVGIQVGFDYNSQNDTFGAGLIKAIGGPKLIFDVPGLLTFGVFYYKEWNNNGIVGKNVNFDATYRLESDWSFNFNLGLPAVFKGFAQFTGAKGKDGFGNDTKPEILSDAALLWDFGSLMGKKGVFFAGVGIEYWHNKFGNNNATVPGSNYTTGTVNMEVHF